MKCIIPEISWHNRDPVLSVDLQPVTSDFYRLASGGGDSHVLIWQLKIGENGAADIEVVTDLTRHQRSVNCVRWSPCGQYLASCDDDSNIILWLQKTDNIPLLDGNTNDKETWIVHKVLRGHKEDVYDLCWSPNSLKLLSGSIDNTAILWDVTKGDLEQILKDHKGFVQGVAWDPRNEFIATASSDRICRIFSQTGKHIRSRLYKGQLPVSEAHSLYSKEVKYFHDDTFKSYFRRLEFSPDGNLLVIPAGCVESDDCKKALNTTYIFILDSLKDPAAVIPSGKQSTVAVRFCPLLFELRTDGPDPIIQLPYRMIFAVATDTDVVLYDTQQTAPIACFEKIHYTRLTDISWSADGLLLIASSTDGFCTLVTFAADELGIPYVKQESDTEEKILDISGCEELEKEELDSQVKEVKPKRPNLLEQWTIKTPKRIKLCENETDNKSQNLEAVKDDVKASTHNIHSSPKSSNTIKKITPKRIAPTPVTKPEASGSNVSLTPLNPIPIKIKTKASIENSHLSTKNSSLLKFLKSTSTNKVKNDIPVDVSEEANDAWSQNSQNSTMNASEDTIDLTEDSIDEDFKLEYSNSTLVVAESHAIKTNTNNPQNCSVSENAVNKENLEDVVTDIEQVKISNESSTNVNQGMEVSNTGQAERSTNKEESSKPEKQAQPKVPRRIPLITLSSPKSKKK